MKLLISTSANTPKPVKKTKAQILEELKTKYAVPMEKLTDKIHELEKKLIGLKAKRAELRKQRQEEASKYGSAGASADVHFARAEIKDSKDRDVDLDKHAKSVKYNRNWDSVTK